MKFGIYDETRGAWVDETRIYAANQEEYDTEGWAPRMEYENKADAAAN